MTHARTKARYAGREEAGFAIRYTAPRQKHAAAVLEIDQSNVSRQIKGEQDGDVSRFYSLIRNAVIDERADAGQMIAGALCVAEEAASELSVGEIVRRLEDRLSQETAFQAVEDIAGHRVLVALGKFVGDADPSDADLRELRSALEDHDTAFRREMGRELDCIVYNRALRVACGWRRRPGR